MAIQKAKVIEYSWNDTTPQITSESLFYFIYLFKLIFYSKVVLLL